MKIKGRQIFLGPHRTKRILKFFVPRAVSYTSASTDPQWTADIGSSVMSTQFLVGTLFVGALCVPKTLYGLPISGRP